VLGLQVCTTTHTCTVFSPLLGIKLRALHMLGKHSTREPHLQLIYFLLPGDLFEADFRFWWYKMKD
jgi:hypothetical protein